MTSKVVFTVGVLAVSYATAATPNREGFVSTVVVSGLSRPSAMALAPDGRIFVAEQDGALRVVKDGILLPEPFLRVTVDASGERGLLGVALDPLFPSNSFVYVYYTAVTPTIHNRVSRFTAAGDVAAAGSEVPLLDLPTLGATNHNGGAVHIGPDGFLYIAVGENAVPAHAQSLNTPLGKLLRIGRDGSIPATNPFFGQTAGINRAIWALGLRNPFTFAFDPWSGRLLINDVGQSAWEEINEGFPGANYGWPLSEGPTTDPAHTSPLYAYTHASTGGCAIAGGAFYPVGTLQFPAEYAGDYFFADLCAGWIRQYDMRDGIVAGNFASGIAAPVGIAVGLEGALYYLARGTGSTTGIVGRIDFAPTSIRPVRRPPRNAGSSGRRAVPRAVAASPQVAAPGPARVGREQSHAEWSVLRTTPADVGLHAPAAVGTAANPGDPRAFHTAHVAPSGLYRQAMQVATDGNGRVRITGATLRQLIQLAAGLPVSGELTTAAGPIDLLAGSMRRDVHGPRLHIVNGPAWLDTQRFDVEAYAGRRPGHDELRRMLHTLLRERFRLVARFSWQPLEASGVEQADQPRRRARLPGAMPAWPVVLPPHGYADVLTIERVTQPEQAIAEPVRRHR